MPTDQQVNDAIKSLELALYGAKESNHSSEVFVVGAVKWRRLLNILRAVLPELKHCAKQGFVAHEHVAEAEAAIAAAEGRTVLEEAA